MKGNWVYIFAITLVSFYMGDLFSKIQIGLSLKFLAPLLMAIIGWVIFKIYDIHLKVKITPKKYVIAIAALFLIPSFILNYIDKVTLFTIFFLLMLYSSSVFSFAIDVNKVASE